jgi:purine-binding chemotaxis protein CheW
MIGVAVDTVSEVLNVASNNIENTPAFGVKMYTYYIIGMAKMEGGIKILLNIDLILSEGKIKILEKAA